MRGEVISLYLGKSMLLQAKPPVAEAIGVDWSRYLEILFAIRGSKFLSASHMKLTYWPPLKILHIASSRHKR